MKRIVLIILMITLLNVNFAFAKKPTFENEEKITKSGVFTFWPAWIKDKGSKYDINMNVKNESKTKSMVVLLRDIECSKDGVRGELKHTLFNIGEKTIDLKPYEHKEFNLVCRFPEKISGKYQIEVKKVYDNPNGDGATRGKVLAENLVWKSSGH